MPEGELVAVPVPIPVFETVRVGRSKEAVTLVSEFIVTVHVPVPEQAPDHPVKFEVESAVAVRVTEVPLL